MGYLVDFSDVQEGVCIARPSKHIKSPYVADVQIGEKTVLAHAPSLGVGGLLTTGTRVIVSKLNPKEGQKCSHCIQALYNGDTIVGANPNHANAFFWEGFHQNMFHEFKHYTKMQREVCCGNSRFDFKLDDNTFVEVKSVLINSQDKVATFPVGTKQKGTISERANKHVDELADMAREGIKCYVVFIVLRDDSVAFAPNLERDPLFCKKLTNAIECGVEVIVYQASVSANGISALRAL